MTTKTSKSNKSAKTTKATDTASAAKTTKDTKASSATAAKTTKDVKASNTTVPAKTTKSTSSTNTDKTAKKVNAANPESIQKVRDLIKGIKIAMLTTISNSDGALHSRPMGTQEVEFDGDLWFFTRSDSQKVNELKKDQTVNVSYANNPRYVSISGTAQIVDDKAKMKELWNPLFKAWFPDGLDDPTLRLLKVTVKQAEYWDNPGGIVATIIGFAESLINKEPSKMGENETITLRK
ncbi:MAG: pyridoxamine 5'-phosphate oxidase family protein [Anaerolineae bacterium]|nr:pyridoxamine 5'-phosphate oxidase family protein [Anaerolineae bacterium]